MNGITVRPLVTAGVLLGVGMGAFFDGIVLHQILQWHHMVSVNYPPTTIGNLELNTLADGLFHAFSWIVTAVGLFALWLAARSDDVLWSGRALVGALLAGWGAFNLVEGIVDHFILGVHHVRSVPNPLPWDLAFLAWGAVMVVAGWAMIRAVQHAYRTVPAGGD